MPVLYFINVDQQTVFSTFSGHVSNAEIIAHQSELKDDLNFNPSMHELMDCTGETSVDHKVHNVMGLVQSSPWGGDSKRAIVAPDPLIFGRSKVFQTYISIEHGNVRVFRGVDAAKRWLAEN